MKIDIDIDGESLFFYNYSIYLSTFNFSLNKRKIKSMTDSFLVEDKASYKSLSPSPCSICGKDIEHFKSQLSMKIRENRFLAFQCRVLKTELINLIGIERTQNLFDLKQKKCAQYNNKKEYSTEFSLSLMGEGEEEEEEDKKDLSKIGSLNCHDKYHTSVLFHNIDKKSNTFVKKVTAKKNQNETVKGEVELFKKKMNNIKSQLRRKKLVQDDIKKDFKAEGLFTHSMSESNVGEKEKKERENQMEEIRHQRIYSKRSPKSLLDEKRGSQPKFLSDSKTIAFNIKNEKISRNSKFHKRNGKENNPEKKENANDAINSKVVILDHAVVQEEKHINHRPLSSPISNCNTSSSLSISSRSNSKALKLKSKPSLKIKANCQKKIKDNEDVTFAITPNMKNNLKASKNQREKWDKVVSSLGEALANVKLNTDSSDKTPTKKIALNLTKESLSSEPLCASDSISSNKSTLHSSNMSERSPSSLSNFCGKEKKTVGPTIVHELKASNHFDRNTLDELFKMLRQRLSSSKCLVFLEILSQVLSKKLNYGEAWKQTLNLGIENLEIFEEALGSLFLQNEGSISIKEEQAYTFSKELKIK